MKLIDIFRRPDYQSDTTQFFNQLKAQKPTLEAEQREGRLLLWDKPVDLARIPPGQSGAKTLRLPDQGLTSASASSCRAPSGARSRF